MPLLLTDGLRLASASLLASPAFDTPWHLQALLYASTLLYLGLVIVSYPAATVDPGQCLQPWVIVGVTLLFYTYQCAISLIVHLQNPFAYGSDSFDVDATMCSSELAVWTLLRSPFQGGRTSSAVN